MFNRRTLLKSSPLAAFALVSNPRFVQGPENLVLPSRQIETPLSEPLVIATEVLPTKVEVSKGYVYSIDLSQPVQKVYSIYDDGTQPAYIRGLAEAKVVLYLTQIGNLQELMGKEVTLYTNGP